jgi:hypothetical protein
MKRSLPEWYSHEALMTKHYAYLLQQVEETLDLASHIWSKFQSDDQDEWRRVPDIVDAAKSGEKETLYRRSSIQSRTRKQTFSYLIFCQAYNGLDAYLDRIITHAPRHYQLPNKSLSKLESRRYDLDQNGINFLAGSLDYQRANTIRECRNLITHNQGVITPAFNRLYPTIPPGTGQRIRLYPVDVAADADFLVRECFRLDGNAAQCFGIERKTFDQWQDEYGIVEGSGPGANSDTEIACQT